MAADQKIKVLVAAANAELLEYLHSREDVEVIEAVSAAGILGNLPRVQLLVLDRSTVSRSEFEVGLLGQLENSILPVVSPEEFLSDPEKWLAEVAPIPEGADRYRPTTIALVSSSGGVGCTTLAIDTALEFARMIRLPVLLMDFVQGLSGLGVLANRPFPTLWECVEWSRPPGKWQGITVVPMDFGVSRTLPVERLRKYLRALFSAHALRVLDVKYPHPLLEAVEGWVDRWFIVATPRADALANASYLRELLAQRPTTLLLNRASLGSRAAVGDSGAAILGEISSTENFNGKLGREILNSVFPNWKEQYEPKGITNRLRRILSRGTG